jgi:hypothetical protein
MSKKQEYIDFMKGYRNTIKLKMKALDKSSSSDNVQLIMFTGMVSGVNEAIKQAEGRL